MTKQQKRVLIVAGVGGLALWWFYRSRLGLPLVPTGVAGVMAAGGGTVQGSAGFAREPLGSIDSPEIVAARGAATGAGSRKSCPFPLRWIKTVSPPYYGFCVTEAQLNEWKRVSVAVDQYFPTDADVRRLMPGL